MSCLFCQLQSDKDNILCEDEMLYVIVDRFPFSNRHLLIIPKDHVELFHQCPESTICAMVLKARWLAVKLGMGKYNILQNNINGQFIKHCHLHLVEANESGSLSLKDNATLKLDDEEYKELVAEVKGLL